MEVSGHLHTPGRFTLEERDPGTHWIEGWVGPRAGMDTVAKRKNPITTLLGIEPRSYHP